MRHLLHTLVLAVLLSGCATPFDTSLLHKPSDVRAYDAPVPTEEDAASIYLYAGCNFCPVKAYRNHAKWVLFTLESGERKLLYTDHRWPGEQLLKLAPPKKLPWWHEHYKKHGIVWHS